MLKLYSKCSILALIQTSKPTMNYPTSFRINHGQNILPIKRMEIFSAAEWETFIEEWLDTKQKQYIEIERFGGAGDKGRDVAAYVTDPKIKGHQWDCYQCKHYDHPLSPAEMYIEFGKIIYYSFIKEYPVPDKYYFVAPRGCGTSMTKLLQDPDSIKAAVKAKWITHIGGKIISGVQIDLTGTLLDYVEKFDFTIFDRIQPKKIIQEHSVHPNHLQWFGGGLPDREILDEAKIPSSIAANESIYVNELLTAYNSDHTETFTTINDINPVLKYNNHFTRARIGFHHAEQLRNFSRDNLPNGAYDLFQDEIYNGIINIVEDEHKNGFDRVKKVETHSSTIAISSNAIKDVTNVKDKTGVCHQLCNDQKIKWV